MVWNIWIFFPYIRNVIIPTDELIFFRGVGQPPTSSHSKSTLGIFRTCLPGNSSKVLVVEARDRGFQVHVLLNMERARCGDFWVTIKHGIQWDVDGDSDGDFLWDIEPPDDVGKTVVNLMVNLISNRNFLFFSCFFLIKRATRMVTLLFCRHAQHMARILCRSWTTNRDIN